MHLNPNINNYIYNRLQDLRRNTMIHSEYDDLYQFIQNDMLRSLVSSLHYNLIFSFRRMNERLPTKDSGAHFWAEPSRILIKTIDIVFELNSKMKKSEYPLSIDAYYFDLMSKCRDFLSSSGGSDIPPNMMKINLYSTIPIFELSNSIITATSSQNIPYELKLIGGGSYANVYKYKDLFYEKTFVIKRAKKDLSLKELERFEREFSEMKKLSSPYIVEVYHYDKDKNQYIMEFMDLTLRDYIIKNQNNLTVKNKKTICSQILKAFKYINSKDVLHRDISPYNILLKIYEDISVVKVSDFGLVKIIDSSLTSINSEFKGSFNDPALVTEGFNNYVIQHETYALTKIVFFVMTGKTNTNNIQNDALKSFVSKGLHSDKMLRYQNASEMISALKTL